MVQPGHIVTPVAAVEHADGAAAMALVFRAGPLTCALPLDEVVETMRPLRVRSLAGTPDFVPGISIMRGVPVPVVDMAVLLAGAPAQVSRFVAVRTHHGTVALATGSVLGLRSTTADPSSTTAHPSGFGLLLGGTAGRLVASVATLDGEPLLLLHSMRHLPPEVWAAAAAAGS